MEVSVEKKEELTESNEIEFYAVSQKKFLILFLGTFGTYSVYWFFKHWNLYKKSTDEGMWPIMRGIFSIFFVHSLFAHFEMKYQKKTGEAPRSINSLATIFIISSLFGNIGNKLAENGYGVPFTFYSGIVALPIVGWCLYQAQSLANYASNDVQASSNSELTGLNYFWLALGGIYWLLMIIGLYAITTGM